MTASNSAKSARLEFAPEVAALLSGTTPQAKLGQSFVRFAESLLMADPTSIDQFVTSDARFHELEAAGFPPGPLGLKTFRKQINTAFPDEHVVIVAMRIVRADTIETDLDCTATHLGELMGIPASGRAVRFLVHTRNRFVDGRMAERWDKTDFEDLLRQIRVE
jgi:predicted ester cyclase